MSGGQEVHCPWTMHFAPMNTKPSPYFLPHVQLKHMWPAVYCPVAIVMVTFSRALNLILLSRHDV